MGDSERGDPSVTVWEGLVGQNTVVRVLIDAAEGARRLLEADASAQVKQRAETTHVLATQSAIPVAPVKPETEDHAHGRRSMSHAWLMTGPPGSGRSNAAKAFAAALQCTGADVGCGQCAGCRAVMNGSHPDVFSISTEANQLLIDEVRGLIGRAQVAPSQGRWRIIIIEDADRMAERTSNVLLKAIEEPPARTVWLLCAPTAEDMMTTIRSRCRHLGLRIPSVQAVADLLVKQDGVEPQIALEAARSAQSHIGLARALARDPELRKRRRDIITAPIMVRSVGEAVQAAQRLLETAKAQAQAQTEERNATEKAHLLRQLGMEEGARLTPALRSQVRQLEEEQKRRSRRALTDTLDRALLDLLAIYRDVLIRQLGSDQELVNEDLAQTIDILAAESTPHQTIARVSAIELARTRLTTNVAPALALEAMAISLRPQYRP